MKSELDYLLSPRAIRERSLRVFEACENGETHFAYHPEQLDPVVDFVVAVTRANYPTLEIPFHSRWGHFRAGGMDRMREFDEKTRSFSAEDRVRAKLDLVVVSVLLDAGAGEKWSFNDGRKPIGRSEGLAVASFRMFMAGAFSHDPAKPFRATAAGLQRLTRAELEKGFQVGPANPLVGVEGRLELVRALGRAIEGLPGARPGGIYDAFALPNGMAYAKDLLRCVLDVLGPIWPGRVSLEGVNLGDCWPHPLVGLIPFHKLSQWLTYSMIEPFEEAGVKIHGVEEMTGLPEYRNGGLLLDRGLISLRDPALASRAHAPGSELVVEWRALTVTLLDRIGAGVRAKLGFTEAEFPLAKALEGGTWWAGRAAAKEKRADGSPPLRLDSDGTVF